MHKIYFLNHNQIDKKKWDITIASSFNKLIYANSWYLDIVSPNWEALILGDYDYVMPIPVKSRFGFKYVVQPILAKQLGVFSKHEISQEIVHCFIDETKKHYSYFRLNLNRFSLINKMNSVIIKNYLNHEVDLSISYEQIRKNYKKRTSLNLNRAIKGNITCQKLTNPDDPVKFIFENSLYIPKNVRLKYISYLRKLNDIEIIKGKIEAIGAFYQNKMVAAGIFLFDEKRVFNLLAASNQTGKDKQALYLTVDFFIRNNSGTNVVLDFTGSSIENIKFYLESFGAKPFQYQNITYKNVRFPLNLILR